MYPIGAVSSGSQGRHLSEIGELRAAGCVAISDDGRPVADALLMRRALEYAGMFKMPVIDHCEEPSLKGDGVAHEGYQASVLGLRGIPSVAEEIAVARNVTLGELTGEAVHIAHISARGSLRAVKSGKDRGVRVTCEVTPHHFTLTDAALAGYDTNYKMNPPLREEADRDALLQGLVDGSIDVIATDHAPHHYDEKRAAFDSAPFGVVGLETAVSIALDRLVNAGLLSLSRLVELFSVNPARILNVPGGTLAPGTAADITVLAPDLAVTVQADRFRVQGAKHPVRRLAAARRRRGHPRGWPAVVHQRRGRRQRLCWRLAIGRVISMLSFGGVQSVSRREEVRERALQDLQRFDVLMVDGPL